MSLPHGERAVVEIEKLRDYCLSQEHPRGRHKARVFASTLGLAAVDAPRLQQALLDAARNTSATVTHADQYGQRYVLDFSMTTEKGAATVRSTWIVRRDEDFPRLTPSSPAARQSRPTTSRAEKPEKRQHCGRSGAAPCCADELHLTCRQAANRTTAPRHVPESTAYLKPKALCAFASRIQTAAQQVVMCCEAEVRRWGM